MLFDITRSVLGAGEIIARIAALVTNACKIGRAAAIPQANGNGGGASLNANADRLVIEHLAGLFRRRTRIAHGARALTASGQAGQVGSAVVVDATLNGVGATRHFAGVVQHETMLADAQRPVMAHLATLALVADFVAEVTRVLTRADRLVTGLTAVAFAVPGAAHHRRGRRWRH